MSGGAGGGFGFGVGWYRMSEFLWGGGVSSEGSFH